MSDVKVLIAGNSDFGIAEKGDVVEVVPSTHDWGSRTVAPDWIRLTITNAPGAQDKAEDTLREYLGSWRDAFAYSKVSGASAGQQRYRIEIIPELSSEFDLVTKQSIRDKLLSAFNGSLASQSKIHMEFDSDVVDHPLDELQNVMSLVAFRRFRFPDSLVDSALATVSPGEPAEFTRTFNWVKSNVIDKLRT